MIENTLVNPNAEYGIPRLSLEGCPHDFHFDFGYYLHYSNHLIQTKSYFGGSSRPKGTKIIFSYQSESTTSLELP